jgi:hypothetical protein
MRPGPKRPLHCAKERVAFAKHSQRFSKERQ